MYCIEHVLYLKVAIAGAFPPQLVVKFLKFHSLYMVYITTGDVQVEYICYTAVCGGGGGDLGKFVGRNSKFTTAELTKLYGPVLKVCSSDCGCCDDDVLSGAGALECSRNTQETSAAYIKFFQYICLKVILIYIINV